MEMQYRMNDLANKLNLKESTARKYFLLVEKKGHIFKRSNQGHILFTEDDISLFQEIIRLKNHPDYSIESAIDHIINVENNNSRESHEGESGLVPYQQFQTMKDEMTAELRELLKEQNKANKELLQEQQSNYEKQLEEAREQQRLYLEKIESIEKKLEEEKKGFWAKLFGG